MNATQRLWARRLIRTGWLLGPILQMPVSIGNSLWRHFFSSRTKRGDRIFHWIILLMVSSASGGLYHLWHINQYATPAEIAAYYKDPCIAELTPRLVASYPWRSSKPMDYGDLRDAKSKCDDARAERDILIQQQNAAKAVK